VECTINTSISRLNLMKDTPSLPRRLLSLTGICLLSSVLSTQLAGYALSWGAITVYLTSYLHSYNSAASLSLLSTVFNYSTPAYSIGSRDL